MADWYPISLDDRAIWHNAFAVRAASDGALYGLTPAMVAQIGADATTIRNVVAYTVALEAYTEASFRWRDAMLDGDPHAPRPATPTPPSLPVLPAGSLPGIQARTRGFAAILRASPDYTRAAGEAFGIIAAAPREPVAPRLRATPLELSQVALRVFKGGHKVVLVEGRRGSGEWETIGVATTLRFLDPRPPLVAGQPEVREYRARGIARNLPVGHFSGVVSAVTQP